MLVIALLVAAVAVASAQDRPALILKSSSEFDPEQGKYSYRYNYCIVIQFTELQLLSKLQIHFILS